LVFHEAFGGQGQTEEGGFLPDAPDGLHADGQNGLQDALPLAKSFGVRKGLDRERHEKARKTRKGWDR
jgi:hypothetical protein